MISKAFDNDLVGGDTMKAFRQAKNTLKPGSDVRDRVITPDEFDALMKHSDGHTRAIIATGYYTGMRKGEIVNLTWDKVDFPNRTIRLEAGDTKDKEARNIPICKELLKILMALPNRIHGAGKNNHVFQYEKKSIKNMVRSFKKACKDAAIKYGRFEKGGFIFHDLRHTFNTNMRKAGVAESVIMNITGHSTRKMFDRYNVVDEADRRNAVDQFEGFLQNVTQTVTQEAKNGK
jgi:integrase